MNRRFARALLMVGGLVLVARAAGEIYLVGVAQEGAVVRVSLHDTETRLAAWVLIGETFMGNKVIALSEKRDEVTLRRETGEYKVRLRKAVLQPYDDPSPEIRDKRFLNALMKVAVESHRNLRTMTVEEVIQFAANFGRVVLSREARPEQDVIVLGLPGTSPDVARKDMPSMTHMPKDGSRGYTILFL